MEVKSGAEAEARRVIRNHVHSTRCTLSLSDLYSILIRSFSRSTGGRALSRHLHRGIESRPAGEEACTILLTILILLGSSLSRIVFYRSIMVEFYRA